MAKFFERLFVWAGGAMFVGSLSLTAWWYAVRFAEDRPPNGWMPIGLDALLLTLFALHHSAFAREPIKRQLANVIPADLLRSFSVRIASVLLVSVEAFWQPWCVS